jgi:hypothetical protein
MDVRTVWAVRLERHDEPADQQYSFQDHEYGGACIRGTPLIRARSKHPEQTQTQEEAGLMLDGEVGNISRSP